MEMIDIPTENAIIKTRDDFRDNISSIKKYTYDLENLKNDIVGKDTALSDGAELGIFGVMDASNDSLYYEDDELAKQTKEQLKSISLSLIALGNSIDSSIDESEIKANKKDQAEWDAYSSSKDNKNI